MKNISNYIVWFTFFVMVIYITSLFLPSSAKISHSELIYGEMNEVYQQFNQIENWKNWCVWNENGQKNQIVYSEESSGTGAFFRWKHRKDYRSSGKLEIVNAKRNQSIELFIKASSIDSIFSYIHFLPTEQGVLVEWTADLELQDSGARLMGYFLKRWLIRDIKNSLRNINEYLLKEGKHTGWISDEYKIFKAERERVVSFRDTIHVSDFDSLLNVNFLSFREQVIAEYDYTPKILFYRKLSTLSPGVSVYLFGTHLPDGVSGMGDQEEFSGKYLLMKYLGSGTTGYKKVLRRAQKIARKEGVRLDGSPYVCYARLPEELTGSDTNSITFNFPIH